MTVPFSITMTSDDLDRDAGRAERATGEGPVLVTDDGRPAYVLMSFADYERLLGRPASVQSRLIDRIADPEGDDIEFAPGRFDLGLQRDLAD